MGGVPLWDIFQAIENMHFSKSRLPDLNPSTRALIGWDDCKRPSGGDICQQKMGGNAGWPIGSDHCFRLAAGKGGTGPARVRHAELARCANEVGTKVPDQLVWRGTMVGDERLELPTSSV